MSVKYIAAGFMHDFNKLISDYLSLNSLEFKSFAEVWKNNNFSCVIMCRPDLREFILFVNEVYQIILNYMMTTTSKEHQIGCMYTLYALFRNQTRTHPIRIRVTLDNYEVFKCLKDFALQNNSFSLLYVLDYLFTNCFELVASHTLFGPCTNKKKDTSKLQTGENSMLPFLKNDVKNFYESKVLDDLKTLYVDYLKKNQNIEKQDEKIDAKKKDFDKITKGIKRLLGDEQSMVHVENAASVSEDIGQRRLKLKQSSFQKKAAFRYLNDVEEDVEHDPDFICPTPKASGPSKPVKYMRRLPPHLRKSGRRSKKYYEEAMRLCETEKRAKIPPEHNRRKKMNRRSAVSYITNDAPSDLVLKSEPQNRDSGDELQISNINEELSSEEEDNDHSDASSGGELRF